MQFGVSTLHVVTKLDLLSEMGKPIMPLDFFVKCEGLEYLFGGEEEGMSKAEIQ